MTSHRTCFSTFCKCSQTLSRAGQKQNAKNAEEKSCVNETFHRKRRKILAETKIVEIRKRNSARIFDNALVRDEDTTRMGSKEVEMGPLLAAAPQLRRSPRRHGSDSDLDTTAGTTGAFEIAAFQGLPVFL